VEVAGKRHTDADGQRMGFSIDLDHDVVLDKARELAARAWELLGQGPVEEEPVARKRLTFLDAYQERARRLKFKPQESINAVKTAVSRQLRPGVRTSISTLTGVLLSAGPGQAELTATCLLEFV
jgi:hypothetical protein